MQTARSRICECDICGREEVIKQTVLPDGWVLLWEIPIMLCDTCLARWRERFDEDPAIFLEGGEKELTLFEEWM